MPNPKVLLSSNEMATMIEDINKKGQNENMQKQTWYSYLLGKDDDEDLIEEEKTLFQGIDADIKKAKEKKTEVCEKKKNESWRIDMYLYRSNRCKCTKRRGNTFLFS